MAQTILVVGGAGFIGSHINRMLQKQGDRTIVLDDLSSGNRKAASEGIFIEGSMGDAALLDRLFKSYSIDAVMHFAACIDVGESVRDPAKYYHNNVSNTLTLLQAMAAHRVKNLIFSSTAAVYGHPQANRLSEAHPTHPVNPYGSSKRMVEQIVQDFDRAYGLRSCCLRYFNAAGGDPEGELKNFKTKESNLIPLALRSLLATSGSLTIFGTDYPTRDGTCVRDYIHVADLGAAHIAAMRRLVQGGTSSIYNLGNGSGFSVKEVLAAVEKVTGRKLNLIQGAKRQGDPPYLVADASHATQELGWKPCYPSLETMITHAWQALQ